MARDARGRFVSKADEAKEEGPLRMELGELRDLRAAIRSLRGLAEPVRRQALVTAAHAINGEAKTKAPVATGYLQGTHTVDEYQAGSVQLGATARYAAPVHERHRTHKYWYLRVIIEEGPRMLRGAMQLAAEDVARRVTRGGGA